MTIVCTKGAGTIRFLWLADLVPQNTGRAQYSMRSVRLKGSAKLFINQTELLSHTNINKYMFALKFDIFVLWCLE